MSGQTIADFAQRRIKLAQQVRSDALPALNALPPHVIHIKKGSPPEMAKSWLSRVHIVIANLKRFLLGTYHEIGPNYIQSYFNEFAYRFNRRFWEAEIPNRLLRLCVNHAPDC